MQKITFSHILKKWTTADKNKWRKGIPYFILKKMRIRVVQNTHEIYFLTHFLQNTIQDFITF